MKRPKLNEVPIPDNLFSTGMFAITMSPGQWDYLLQNAYENGALLLEIESNGYDEAVTKAYRKP